MSYTKTPKSKDPELIRQAMERRATGATQQSIAEALGVNATMVRDWMTTYGDPLPKVEKTPIDRERLLDTYFNSSPGETAVALLAKVRQVATFWSDDVSTTQQGSVRTC